MRGTSAMAAASAGASAARSRGRRSTRPTATWRSPSTAWTTGGRGLRHGRRASSRRLAGRARSPGAASRRRTPTGRSAKSTRAPGSCQAGAPDGLQPQRQEPSSAWLLSHGPSRGRGPAPLASSHLPGRPARSDERRHCRAVEGRVLDDVRRYAVSGARARPRQRRQARPDGELVGVDAAGELVTKSRLYGQRPLHPTVHLLRGPR